MQDVDEEFEIVQRLASGQDKTLPAVGTRRLCDYIIQNSLVTNE
jgi:hypothetical protein